MTSSLKDRVLTTIAVAPNPDIANLKQMYPSFWRIIDGHQPVVVAIGGGSVIDGAKVLRHSWTDARGDFGRVIEVLEERRLCTR